MHPKTLLTATVAATALAFGAPAAAGDDGWYLIGSVGQTSVRGIDQEALDAILIDGIQSGGIAIIDGDSSVDDSDTTFEIGVGYQVGENFAAELTYVDLGEASYSASGTLTDGVSIVDLNVGLTAQAKAPVVSFLGIWPVSDRFAAFARLGLAFVRTEADATASLDGGDSITLPESANQTSFVYGLGVEYDCSDRFALRAGYNRYTKVGDNDTIGESDIDTLTLGVRYSF